MSLNLVWLALCGHSSLVRGMTVTRPFAVTPQTELRCGAASPNRSSIVACSMVTQAKVIIADHPAGNRECSSFAATAKASGCEGGIVLEDTNLRGWHARGYE